MTVAAATDYFVLFHIDLFNFLYRVAGKALTAALRHGIGIGTVAFDTAEHRFVACVLVNRRHQFGMAGQAIAGTGDEVRKKTIQ